MANTRSKGGKKSTIETTGTFSILNDEVPDDAAAPTGLADQAGTAIENKSAHIPLPQLSEQLKAATSLFEAKMGEAMKTVLDSLKEVQHTLEFEGRRITDLEKRNTDLEKRLEKVEKVNQELERRLLNQDLEANVVERLAKRDNFRIVGHQEAEAKGGKPASEDCVNIAEEILKSKFKFNMKVEAAYRVGMKGEKPRHIVVKTRSHQDKVKIMKDARSVLEKEDIYFIDDLTRRDLEAKKKYRKDVQELYAKGIKLRFFAGHWRGSGGAPYFSS